MAEVLVLALGVYCLAGVAFAIPFAWIGVARVDPDARGATWGFRLILMPGAVALWPILLVRWLRGTQPPMERTPHKKSVGA